jgi:3D (Asp-Asp-Asp) domain-containing protein
MKKITLFLCAIVLIFVLISGCINLKMTETVKVNKNAEITNMNFAMKMDRATYNLLKSSADSQGQTSVKEMISANLSKSLGTENTVYNEVWDNENDKVTISVERKDTHVAPADSKIIIQKINNQIIYEDTTFYSEKKPKETSPYFNDTQMEQMTNMMMSGISIDYYLEMPGNIVDSNAGNITGNKAEWHFSGADASKTKIYAKSDIPMLPGFTGLFAILALTIIIGYFGIIKRK